MQKNITVLVTFLTLCLLSPILAASDHQHGGYVDSNQTNADGFQDSSLAVNTVAQVKKMSDDQHVVLRGYIVKSIGDEEYLFKDDSGTISVEINHKRWRGQIITPNDFVEIQGKIDKDWNSIEIEVKRIFKIVQTPN